MCVVTCSTGVAVERSIVTALQSSVACVSSSLLLSVYFSRRSQILTGSRFQILPQLQNAASCLFSTTGDVHHWGSTDDYLEVKRSAEDDGCTVTDVDRRSNFPPPSPCVLRWLRKVSLVSASGTCFLPCHCHITQQRSCLWDTVASSPRTDIQELARW